MYAHVENESTIKIHGEKPRNTVIKCIFVEPLKLLSFLLFLANLFCFESKTTFAKLNSSIKSVSKPCKINLAVHELET